ncbi:MAG TPA: hypothetical protein VIC08_13920 [Cellvibrionaceae bacterium]
MIFFRQGIVVLIVGLGLGCIQAHAEETEGKLSFKEGARLAKSAGALWAQSRICQFEVEGFKSQFFSYIDKQGYKEKQIKKIEKTFEDVYLKALSTSMFDADKSRCPEHKERFYEIHSTIGGSIQPASP